MNKQALTSNLNSAIDKYKRDFKILQRNHSYCPEETQSAINSLGSITLEALEHFKTAILNNID